MAMPDPASNSKGVSGDTAARPATYWRVEGSLLELGALRPVGFFTWNAQSFAERWARRAGFAWMTMTRPIDYAVNRTLATRLLHTLLRGVSRDRLDLLGEEYFHYVLKPQLRPEAVEIARPYFAVAGAAPRRRVIHFQPHGISQWARHGAFARSRRASARAIRVDN